MAKIGIYGGSFDPITDVTLITANTVAHRCKLDKVIFVPCSSRRLDKQMSVSDKDRWTLLTMAIAGNSLFEADDYELHLLAWDLETYGSMKHYKEKYPNDEVYFIMGANLLIEIGEGNWRNAESLVLENKFIVMARCGINMLKAISASPLLRNADDGERFHLIDTGLVMEDTAPYIRDEFARGGDPRFLLPDPCYRYIKTNNLYYSKGV